MLKLKIIAVLFSVMFLGAACAQQSKIGDANDNIKLISPEANIVIKNPLLVKAETKGSGELFQIYLKDESGKVLLQKGGYFAEGNKLEKSIEFTTSELNQLTSIESRKGIFEVASVSDYNAAVNYKLEIPVRFK